MAGTLLDACGVFARTGVDADHFVLVDEQRHADHGAGFQGGRLAAAAPASTAALVAIVRGSCFDAAAPNSGSYRRACTSVVKSQLSTNKNSFIKNHNIV